MKKYLVRTELIPYVTRIMHRSYRSIYVSKESGNSPEMTLVHADADPEIFQKICFRAFCEKKTHAEGNLYCTDEECRNYWINDAEFFLKNRNASKEGFSHCMIPVDSIEKENIFIPIQEDDTQSVSDQSPFMQTYFVSSEVFGYLCRLMRLSYRGIRKTMMSNGFYEVYAEADPDVFRRILVRALCEKQTHLSGISCISEDEKHDGFLRKSLLEPFGLPAESNRFSCRIVTEEEMEKELEKVWRTDFS